MKILEASFFAYPVTDMARSRKFYEGILGLKPSLVSEITPWIEYDLGNTTLGLGCYEGWKPSADGAMLAFEVDDFEKSVAELKLAGVPVSFDPMETPICHFAIIRDPDGNAIMIHKRKPGHN